MVHRESSVWFELGGCEGIISECWGVEGGVGRGIVVSGGGVLLLGLVGIGPWKNSPHNATH